MKKNIMIKYGSILDMDTWFKYYQIPDEDKVPLSKLKIMGLAKLLVIEWDIDQNLVTTWSNLVESITLED